MAERGVVDLEDGAGVVAEVAQQPEVDLDPVRGSPHAQPLEVSPQPGGRALHRDPAEARAPRSSTSLPPRSWERATQVATCSSPIPSTSASSSSRPTKSCAASRARTQSRASSSTPELGQQLAVEVGVAEADHRPVQPGRVQGGL